jgi:hypothetical protein
MKHERLRGNFQIGAYRENPPRSPFTKGGGQNAPPFSKGAWEDFIRGGER